MVCLYAGAMNRLFLTLLALLTGLVTQAAPAQAALCTAGETEIGAVDASGSSRLVAAVAAGEATVGVAEPCPDAGSFPVLAQGAPPVAAVLIGIDRSRE